MFKIFCVLRDVERFIKYFYARSCCRNYFCVCHVLCKSKYSYRYIFMFIFQFFIGSTLFVKLPNQVLNKILFLTRLFLEPRTGMYWCTNYYQIAHCMSPVSPVHSCMLHNSSLFTLQSVEQPPLSLHFIHHPLTSQGYTY